MAIQGALDPALLRAGGPALTARVDELLRHGPGGPYVFNLGHGVLPDTPIEHIAAVVDQVTALAESREASRSSSSTSAARTARGRCGRS